jgi:ribosomal protein S18 acetylase RimI-like enzyme
MNRTEYRISILASTNITYLRTKYSRGDKYKYFILLNGEKIGSVSVEIMIKDKMHPKEFGYLDNLIIKNKYRNQGFGKKLMRYVLRDKILPRKLQLSAQPLNKTTDGTKLKKFYTSLGFARPKQHAYMHLMTIERA